VEVACRRRREADTDHGNFHCSGVRWLGSFAKTKPILGKGFGMRGLGVGFCWFGWAEEAIRKNEANLGGTRRERCSVTD
jgi:hypothetical protein